MTITNRLTSSGIRRILGVLLALALLISAAGASPAPSVPTEPYFAGSGTFSDGEDVLSIGEVWQQGFDDGGSDGAAFWRGYSLGKRLKEHHYNTEQILAYTDGYKLGYALGKW